MGYEYTLPVLASPTPIATTYTTTGNTAVTITGTLALSCTPNITTGFSAVGPVVRGTLAYTAGGTALSSLSASPTGIVLTLLNNVGNIIEYGYIESSTLVPATSTLTATIKFRSPNFLGTTFTISGFRATTRFLSGGATPSEIDNLLVRLNETPGYTVNQGLTSINSNGFRTVSRQVRLVQGEY